MAADPIAFFKTLPKEERGRLVAEEHARVVAAREDIVAFFEYVMREPVTKDPNDPIDLKVNRVPKRIKALPHQRVGLSFIMHHDRSVNCWFVGSSKTFCMVAVTLFLLGRDPTTRGAIVSATQTQAEKVLAVVADYVEHSAALRRVFPELRKTRRPRDKWNQTAITIDRPAAIPDPSLVAIGVGSALLGSRLNWVVVDDVLSFDNTLTKEARDKTYAWIDATVLSRLDPVGAKVVMTNTPWHPDDVVHRLERHGWPSLRMNIWGEIRVQDDLDWMKQGRSRWDHEELRPVPNTTEEAYRLRSHDPDPNDEVPLWPEKFSREVIDKELRPRHPHPAEFGRMFSLTTRDDSTAMCKQEYVDKCLRLAREAGHYSMVSRCEPGRRVFTGVDLAVDKGEEHDETAFFTFEVLEDGTRKVLDVDIGQWTAPEIIHKITQKKAAYDAVVTVENNSAQKMLIQMANDRDKELAVKGLATTRAKHHPEHGIAGFFAEMENGSWLFPNDRAGRVHPMIQKLIDACLYFKPSAHTPDVLSAVYMGREQARRWGMLAKKPKMNGAGSIQASLLSR